MTFETLLPKLDINVTREHWIKYMMLDLAFLQEDAEEKNL